MIKPEDAEEEYHVARDGIKFKVVDRHGHPVYRDGYPPDTGKDEPALFDDEDEAQECADDRNEEARALEMLRYLADAKASGYEGGKIEVAERLDAIDPPYVWDYAVKMVMPDGTEIEGNAQGEDLDHGGEIYRETFEPD